MKKDNSPYDEEFVEDYVAEKRELYISIFVYIYNLSERGIK